MDVPWNLCLRPSCPSPGYNHFWRLARLSGRPQPWRVRGCGEHRGLLGQCSAASHQRHGHCGSYHQNKACATFQALQSEGTEHIHQLECCDPKTPENPARVVSVPRHTRLHNYHVKQKTKNKQNTHTHTHTNKKPTKQKTPQKQKKKQKTK